MYSRVFQPHPHGRVYGKRPDTRTSREKHETFSEKQPKRLQDGGVLGVSDMDNAVNVRHATKEKTCST